MADFARGEELRRLREGRHLSQEDAAHQIGVSTKSVRSWEKGKPIRWDNAKRVARFYKVPAEELVSRELPDPSPPVDLDAEQLDRIEEEQREQRRLLEEIKEAVSAPPDESSDAARELDRELDDLGDSRASSDGDDEGSTGEVAN